jgi:hypothetical protein
MTTTHPYFTRKARAAFAAAGGDPGKAESLARWAQDAKASGIIRQGVIIGESGTIYARTRDNAQRVGTYVVGDDARALGLSATELGLALVAIRRRTGEAVIHIKASEVTSGASKYIKEGMKAPGLTA